MNTSVSLADIKIDPAAQPRATTFPDKVSDYAERMALGDKFPPMVVFFDGHDHWLADGFHRYQAALGAGRDDFPCEVRGGGLRDAILFSCGANAAHGVQRTQEEKRRAVMKLLQDTEWSQWSDSEIARQAKVDHKTVARLRDEMRSVTREIPSEHRIYRNKHGGVSAMRTGKIGTLSKADE